MDAIGTAEKIAAVAAASDIVVAIVVAASNTVVAIAAAARLAEGKVQSEDRN